MCLHLKEAQSDLIRLSCSHSLVHIASVRIFAFRLEHWSVQRWRDFKNRCSTDTMAPGIARKSQAMCAMTGNSCWWAYSGLLTILRGDIKIIYIPSTKAKDFTAHHIPESCAQREHTSQTPMQVWVWQWRWAMSNACQKWVGCRGLIRHRLQWGRLQWGWLIFLKVVLENFLCMIVRIAVDRPEPR